MGVTLRDGCWAAGGVKKFHQIYAAAADAVHARDYPGAMNLLEEAISLAPNSIDALQLYGALAVKLGDYDRGLPYIQKAIELDNWTNPEVVSNYIQALRLDGRMEKALEVARKAVALFPTSISLLVNSAYAFMDAKDIHSTDLFEAVLKLRPDNLDYWQGLIEVYLRLGLIKEAEAVAKRGAKLHPQSGRMMYYLGHCAQLQDRITEALELYQISTQLDPSDREAWAGIGGAFQELGQLEDAADVYSRIAEISMNDHAFLNNFGALLTNMDHRHEEGEMYLRKAIEMKPDSLKTLANLGTYYHDEGSIPLAREMFHRASAAYQSRHTEHNNLFGLRAALILPQVPSSYENMVDERNRLERELREFIAHSPPTGPKDVLDGVFDRTVFYIQYHGFNDRLIQELISEVYRKNILDFEVFNELANPSLSAIAMNYQKKSKKIRVGFISKFFGVFEPHALLLDGVMQYLPRSKFEVYAFPVTRSDGKPLAPGISEGADVIVPLSLNHAEATIAVSAAGLDILVFADTQSEPMTHFMCHHRIAPVQV